MMKKAISLLLAVGLALSAVPVGAQAYGPNTVWGAVPEGAEGAVNAVLLDSSGKTITMVPVVDGKFAFRDVAPGDYTVGLYTASGQQIDRSLPAAALERLRAGGRLHVCPPSGGPRTDQRRHQHHRLDPHGRRCRRHHHGHRDRHERRRGRREPHPLSSPSSSTVPVGLADGRTCFRRVYLPAMSRTSLALALRLSRPCRHSRPGAVRRRPGARAPARRGADAA